jgi:hypothetical protein
MIDSFTFGRFVVDGNPYKDITIDVSGNVKDWHYVKHHTVTKEDILEILDGAEVLVIGIGTDGCVSVEEEVLEFAKSRNVEVRIENTEKACDVYNDLKKKGKKVSAIFHSTC